MSNRPIIVINFKATKEGTGDNAVALAKKIDRVQSSIPEFEIILALQPQDIYRVAHETKLKIFSQHVDPIQYGNHTGSICPESIKEAGACGTLLNHPEKRLPEKVIKETICIAKNADIEVIVCASSIIEGKRFSKYNPDYIGIEYKEIVGTSRCLLDVYPNIVKDSVCHIKSRLLFGAGIKSREDIVHIVRRGGAGVMISSAVLKASDSEAYLRNLLVASAVKETSGLPH